MQFGPNSNTRARPEGGTAPPPQSGVDAIITAANAAGFPASWALWIAESTGQEAGIISHIPALAAAYEANPGETPGQLAVNVLGATTQQATAVDKLQQSNSASLGTSTGLVTDVVGDFFEVAYPFVMIGLSILLFIFWAILAVSAVNKSAGGVIGKATKTIGKAAAL